MEYCEENMVSIISEKSKYFRNNECVAMNQDEYYICCEIFKEILECVRYLHEELQPPLIHLDIKPQNILFTKQSKSGKFIKLCDFGLSKFHEFNTFSMTNVRGTSKYMATEVLQANGRSQFSNKADIYSLGVTAQDLFEFDINS